MIMEEKKFPFILRLFIVMCFYDISLLYVGNTVCIISFSEYQFTYFRYPVTKCKNIVIIHQSQYFTLYIQNYVCYHYKTVRKKKYNFYFK